MSMKKKKIVKIIWLTVLTLGIFTGLTFLTLDLIEPIKMALELKSWEVLSDKFNDYGIYALLVIGFFQAMLLLITVIPAAPLQIIAGVVLDPISAFLTILAGVFLGNLIIYVLVRKLGSKIGNYYKKENKQLGELKEIKVEKVLSKKVIFLYFLPVIPYGLIAFTCANSKMKFLKYILITTLGTIPSIILSISLGTLIVDSNVFIILILVLIVLTILTIKYYKQVQKIFTKKPKKNMKFFQNNVRKPGRIVYWFFQGLLAKMFFKKVNLNIKNKEIMDNVEGPYILIYNHPSFLDWMYTFIPLYPKRVNAIMAYYYFCNYRLGRLLYRLGCFPKFLYQPDISAIKNIKKVINFGGILGIAPEGRLSAYGELETVAPATEKLIKHLGVPIYLGKINGGYMTKPKWASNIRKGRVDLEYELVLTKEELNEKSLEEIKDILNDKLYYNDFEWQNKNHVYFKGDKFAEGLENILYLCPKCGSEFTMETHDNHITCTNCKTDVVLNNYYEFITDEVIIPKTIKDWYLLQKEYEAKNVISDDYYISSTVKLKLPDPKGKGFIEVGSGLAHLDIDGLNYHGTINGETIDKTFKIQNMPAIPFGANENFEVYHDNTLYYFVPENPKTSVKWSVVGEAIYKKHLKDTNKHE